jgi:hypothetical protein
MDLQAQGESCDVGENEKKHGVTKQLMPPKTGAIVSAKRSQLLYIGSSPKTPSRAKFWRRLPPSADSKSW